MACAALAGGLLQAAPAAAAPTRTPGSSQTGPPQPSGRVVDPGDKLGKGWKTSQDRAVTAAADADGLHVLVADSAKAYEWKTATVLAEPGMTADSWIGNQCVIDHAHAAVVYAPRAFTNKPDLMQGGAFAAMVDLDTGQVTKLPFTVSLAYFDPTCNPATRTAAFTAYRDMNDPERTKTRVLTVNTAGRTTGTSVTTGEVTSAVPVPDGTVAARGRHLVHIDRSGRVKNLATADTVPFDIRSAARGRIAFVDRSDDTTAHVKVVTGHGRPSMIASGRLGDLDLAQGAAGRVFLTGHPTGSPRTQGTGITRLNAPSRTDVSTLGRLAVQPVLAPGVHAGLQRIKNAGRGFTRAEPSEERSAQAPATAASGAVTTVTSTATTTGKKITQSVQGAPETTNTTPGTRSATGKSTFSPALAASGQGGGGKHPARTAAAVSNDPRDTDRWCGVSRNDVNAQALQPTPNQVEWAADMAVRDKLHASVIQQGGYRSQTTLSTIDPQGLFPLPALKGGDGKGRIPVNVLLGIMAQESNLWEAEGGSIPGQMGNPLAAVDGYYGHKHVDGDPDSNWRIHWEKADCGYGVGQVTDGMRLAGHEKAGETSLTPSLQKAVAVDYATNIAASMKILADKWNEVHTAGQQITVNNDDPSMVENWFTAAWNYNLGFNPPSQASQHNGHWGLGWYNNPANPLYAKSWGHPFMDTSADGTDANHDAAHPQDWPYEEKVMGWAAFSIDTGFSYSTSGRQDWPGESGFSSAGFRPAWWTTPELRSQVSPPLSTFCNGNNSCDPKSPPDCPDEACYAKYWWNQPHATWKSDCANDCGHENIKYQTVISEPGRGTRLQHGTPDCSAAPDGTSVVASVAQGTETWSGCKPSQVNSAGSFKFTFYPDPTATGPGLGPYQAKADLHQVGGGYGGHYWYTHTRNTDHLGGDSGLMTIKGTWTLNQSLNGWARVLVHMPDTGAQTQQAHYVIKGVAGGDRHRYINTHHGKNTWVELGVYQFTGTPQVELSNATDDGTADDDVAFTSVAFQKLPGKPQYMVVAMGDSYTSGEGSGDYDEETDRDHGQQSWNACRRSKNAWPRKVTLPGQTETVGTLSDHYAASVDFQFIACSGAKTWQMRPTDDSNPEIWGNDGNFHQKYQIDSGALSSDTTLVMLTIGGNDAQFDKKIQACVLSGCPSESSMKADIDTAVDNTQAVLKKIHGQAPNATISLMGYPLLFSRTEACSTLVSASQRVILNNMAQYFESKQSELATSMAADGVRFRSPQSAFEGKRICDPTEGINGVVAGPNGDGDFHHDDDRTKVCWWFWGDNCLSRESYHPNKTGTTAYAQAFMTYGPTTRRPEAP
ncbi:hypothetical protein ACFY0F_01015 [Streptomyces sp. NPDC001544]|uniref:golvesin C-terminal-like domain-containing protein n=1 Tax=Streptomyces sp. NPDC001544 TaxID=3364584 RepID=UPI003674AFC7